ncbi:MAG: hypothetical protein QOH61_2852 [Chloroflexota bacterium]|jgi:drug/metabolite transporter (DMT)-like permease|nr:hypothetical protein [Chloroflexota bacterium]
MAEPARNAPQAAPGWQVWTALLIVFFVWGSTYIAIRVVVETMPPLLAGGIRFVIAGAIVAVALVARGGVQRLRVSRRELANSALIGLLLLLVGNGLVSVGEKTVASGLAALVVGTIPLFVLLIRWVSRERVAPAALVGVCIGFVGLAVLMVPGGLDGSVDVAGMVFLTIASLSWSIGSYLSGRIALPRDPFVSTAYQLLSGGVLLLLVAIPTGDWRVDPAVFSMESLLSLAYLVTAGSLLAYTAYTWLLQHAPITRVATYAYVNPVVAVTLGWIILNERITLTAAIGAVLIIASVAFTIWTDSTARTRAANAVAEESRAAAGPRHASEPRPAPGPAGEG